MTGGPVLDGGGMMKLQKAFLLLFLCLGELTLLPVEGRGAVGKGSSGRSFKGRTGGRGGTGRGDLDPFNSLSNLHWWQVQVNLKLLLLREGEIRRLGWCSVSSSA